jgi:NitT/TauT family transport system ATP-binding protein
MTTSRGGGGGVRSGVGDVLLCEEITVLFPTRDGGSLCAVDNVSISVGEGELCCLVGPSGCGKSTLLHVIAGLVQPQAGRVLLDGNALDSPRPAVAYLTQRDTLLPWATALDNVILPTRAVGKPDTARARELLALAGLTGFEHHYPHQLSGGMRKRVQFARALAQRPRLLLMDEPFAALDAQTKIIIEREFLSIWERDRISVVFVTHDLAEAIAMADRVLLMSQRPGRIKEEHGIELSRPRLADGVFTEPEYQAIYRSIWASLEEELVV